MKSEVIPIPSRDIWKYGSDQTLKGLLASTLITLLLPVSGNRPVYFASPWMSDFELFDNETRQVTGVFPQLAERSKITFIEYLATLSRRYEVRIITSRNQTSDQFVKALRAYSDTGGTVLRLRISPQDVHEKGILGARIYIDGSMNITRSGVHVNGEKVSYHVMGDAQSDARIKRAHLEFDRRWSLLSEMAPIW